MALSRSASGPGGLTINTSSANMFSGGSSNTQQPAAGGLFGAASQANTSSAPKSLFGGASTTASQPQQTPSLFGTASNTTTSQAQQPSGGLFGSSTATSQPQQTGGLFGGASQTQSQPAQSGGLFGGQSQQPQNTGGGLFGASAQNATQPAQNSVFGGGGGGNTTNTSGAFGGQSANNAAGGGILGQSIQQRPSLFGGFGQPSQSQTNAFGQSQQPPSGAQGATLGFGLTMGQSTAQQTIPGVRIDVSNLKGTTRFNDLQESLQKDIEKVESFIRDQKMRKDEVGQLMSSLVEMLDSVPADVKFVERKYDGAKTALEAAAEAIDASRKFVSQDAESARLSFRAIDNLKLPQQYQSSNFWSPRQQASGAVNGEADGLGLVHFFSQAADEMQSQMNKYDKNLTEIEMHMHGVSDGLVEQLQRMMANKNGAVSGPDAKMQELVAVLRDFEQGILKVAGDVGSAREGMMRLQLGDLMTDESGRNGVH
ncbi:hypothetical protein GGR56DRAFT_618227 [Xylariaceae sp. FL0804]|nr:hypothetical protein GGR56DRAFT_618227 [Xylariaceae sp. FL0804]